MSSDHEQGHEDELIKGLTDNLKSIHATMQTLLSDIKESEINSAVIEEKLEALKEDVNMLSNIIRDADGKKSLITRMALVEQMLTAVETKVEEYNKELFKELESDRDNYRKQSLGKLKAAAVTAPGIISLIVLLIKLFVGEK